MNQPNKLIYFDNAATTFPKPQSVYDRMDKFIRAEAANPGRSGHRMAVEAEAVIERARNEIAKLFGVKDPHRIVFTLNCTDALNMAIKGVLENGGHVVSTQLEHNSVLRPLNALVKAGRISLTRVPHSKEGVVDPADVRKSLRNDTRLVVMTHASNVTGSIQPVREIGRMLKASDAWFLVDAAQTAGCFPIDVEADGIDMLAFPGHKALFGPMGTGGLYVGPRVKLTAWREGGTGGDSKSPTQPEELPFFLEGGTPNAVGIAGLSEGARFIFQEGIEKIRRHECRLIKKLREGLQSIPGVTLFGPSDAEKSTSTLALSLNCLEPQELGAILDQSFGIAARAGLHCAPLIHQSLGTYPAGCLRFSPGYFNTEEDVAAAVAAIREIQKNFSHP